jgi:hypothetical protein
MENCHEKNLSNIFVGFHGIQWKILWNPVEFRGIQWNSMKFSMYFSMEFLGNQWNSMEFNGIPCIYGI